MYRRSERVKHEILQTESCFGLELILIGPEKEKKDIKLRPNVVFTLDGIGRPSSLQPEPNYVGIRHLGGDEVKKIEKGKWSIQQRPDDVKETFRPADRLMSERFSAALQSAEEPKGKVLRGNNGCISRIYPRPTVLSADDSIHGGIAPSMTSNDSKPVKRDQMKRKRLLGTKLNEQVPINITSLPIYAVRVQWKFSPNLPNYSLELVHAVLSCHGRIVSLTQISPNSAVVEFKNVQTARRAIFENATITSCPLICSWWFPEMWSYDKMIREQLTREEKKTIVHLDDETLLKLQFKSTQEKCLIQLKKHIGNLSYDLGSFIP